MYTPQTGRVCVKHAGPCRATQWASAGTGQLKMALICLTGGPRLNPFGAAARRAGLPVLPTALQKATSGGAVPREEDSAQLSVPRHRRHSIGGEISQGGPQVMITSLFFCPKRKGT